MGRFFLEGVMPTVPDSLFSSLPRYWDDFHACTLTALTDCQEGVTDVWEKLKEKSKKLEYEGNLFVLCGKSKGAAPSTVASASPVLLVALSAALATWFSY